MWHLFLMQTWSSDTCHIAFRFQMIKTWASRKQAQWGIPEYSLSVKDAPSPHGTLCSLPCVQFHQLPFSENNIPIYWGAFIVASKGSPQTSISDLTWKLVRKASTQPTSSSMNGRSWEVGWAICVLKISLGDFDAQQSLKTTALRHGFPLTVKPIWTP